MLSASSIDRVQVLKDARSFNQPQKHITGQLGIVCMRAQPTKYTWNFQTLILAKIQRVTTIYLHKKLVDKLCHCGRTCKNCRKARRQNAEFCGRQVLQRLRRVNKFLNNCRVFLLRVCDRVYKIERICKAFIRIKERGADRSIGVKLQGPVSFIDKRLSKPDKRFSGFATFFHLRIQWELSSFAVFRCSSDTTRRMSTIMLNSV